MKKRRRTKRATYWGLAAKSTTKDWGFGAISGKGGKTTNSEIRDNSKKVTGVIIEQT